MRFRDNLLPGDAAAVENILLSTEFFRRDEIDVALSILDPREYSFLFAEGDNGDVIGYSCYSLIPCTVRNYDLYWIAVRRGSQRGGVGTALFTRTVDEIRRKGGYSLFVETSGKDLYRPTRAFYEKCGCRLESVIEDFYDFGDAKYIYRKILR